MGVVGGGRRFVFSFLRWEVNRALEFEDCKSCWRLKDLGEGIGEGGGRRDAWVERDCWHCASNVDAVAFSKEAYRED